MTKSVSELVQLNESTTIHFEELVGKRIRLIKMDMKVYPVPPGAEGKIVGVSYFQDRWNLMMNWDQPYTNRLVPVIPSLDDVELIT